MFINVRCLVLKQRTFLFFKESTKVFTISFCFNPLDILNVKAFAFQHQRLAASQKVFNFAEFYFR